MSKLVLNGAYVSLAGTNLSNHVRSISLETSADIVDASCMTDTWKDKLAGLKDWKLTVEFAQDFDAGSVDATLFPLVGTAAAVVLRPTQAAKSPTNPEFTGNAFLENYNPLDGKVAELAATKIVLAGAGALTRATS
jgi:predicted secreted protein